VADRNLRRAPISVLHFAGQLAPRSDRFNGSQSVAETVASASLEGLVSFSRRGRVGAGVCNDLQESTIARNMAGQFFKSRASASFATRAVLPTLRVMIL